MGVVNVGVVGQNEFLYKISWLVNSILALEPKFHADWSKNGHATRKNPKMDPKKRFFSKIPQDFQLLKHVPQISHQTGHLGWNQYIGTLILS